MIYLPHRRKAFRSAGAADYLTNCIGRWAMTEGTGSTVADTGSSGDDGSIVADVTWTTRTKADTSTTDCLAFAGTNDYVNIQSSGTAPLAYRALGNGTDGDYSLCAWIKTTNGDVNLGNWIVDDTIIELRVRASDSTVHIPFSWGVEVNTLSLGRSNNYISGSELEKADTNCNDGAWHHVAACVDTSTDKVQFYLDGVADGLKTYTNATGDCSVGATANVDMQIGIRSKDTGTKDVQEFSGDLDDVRVYSEVVSAANIQAIYDATK